MSRSTEMVSLLTELDEAFKMGISGTVQRAHRTASQVAHQAGRDTYKQKRTLGMSREAAKTTARQVAKSTYKTNLLRHVSYGSNKPGELD